MIIGIQNLMYFIIIQLIELKNICLDLLNDDDNIESNYYVIVSINYKNYVLKIYYRDFVQNIYVIIAV